MEPWEACIRSSLAQDHGDNFHTLASSKDKTLRVELDGNKWNGANNNVLLVKIEGPVTGIPSIIIYLLYLGGKQWKTNPSIHQPTNGKGHLLELVYCIRIIPGNKGLSNSRSPKTDWFRVPRLVSDHQRVEVSIGLPWGYPQIIKMLDRPF